jgi:alpha-tubulin suppressor-like RCC1 family protein
MLRHVTLILLGCCMVVCMDEVCPVGQTMLGRYTAVVTGAAHTCAILQDSTVQCWGSNDLGVGIRDASGVQARQIAAGSNHTCVILLDHTVQCWGSNSNGQLGSRTDDLFRSPKVVTLSDPLAQVYAIQIVAGDAHSCVLLSDYTVQCWGSNAAGQLGNGLPYLQVVIPTVVASLWHTKGRRVTGLTAASAHTCVLLSDHTIECWGLGFGGLPSNLTFDTPVHDSNSSRVVSAYPTQINAGDAGTCVVFSDHSAQCWHTQVLQERLPWSDVVQIQSGPTHTCVLFSDHRVTCWQSNGDQLIESFGLEGMEKIRVGGNHRCALLSDRTLRCWGSNAYGQLGDGTTRDRAEPTLTGMGPSCMPVVTWVNSMSEDTMQLITLIASGGVGANLFLVASILCLLMCRGPTPRHERGRI